jgi:hypothetical protein
MPECGQSSTVCGQRREMPDDIKSAPSWPMFFANMNLTPESHEAFPWLFECSSNCLAKTCLLTFYANNREGRRSDSQMMLNGKGFTKTDNDKADL